jgi:hypothetical protein
LAKRVNAAVHTRGRLWRNSLTVSLVLIFAMIAVLAVVFVWRGEMPH